MFSPIVQMHFSLLCTWFYVYFLRPPIKKKIYFYCHLLLCSLPPIYLLFLYDINMIVCCGESIKKMCFVWKQPFSWIRDVYRFSNHRAKLRWPYADRHHHCMTLVRKQVLAIYSSHHPWPVLYYRHHRDKHAHGWIVTVDPLHRLMISRDGGRTEEKGKEKLFITLLRLSVNWQMFCFIPIRVRRVDLVIEPGQSLGLMIRGGIEYGLGIYVTGVDKDSVADRAGLNVTICMKFLNPIVCSSFKFNFMRNPIQDWWSNIGSQWTIIYECDPRRSCKPI